MAVSVLARAPRQRLASPAPRPFLVLFFFLLLLAVPLRRDRVAVVTAGPLRQRTTSRGRRGGRGRRFRLDRLAGGGVAVDGHGFLGGRRAARGTVERDAPAALRLFLCHRRRRMRVGYRVLGHFPLLFRAFGRVGVVVAVVVLAAAAGRRFHAHFQREPEGTHGCCCFFLRSSSPFTSVRARCRGGGLQLVVG